MDDGNLLAQAESERIDSGQTLEIAREIVTGLGFIKWPTESGRAKGYWGQSD